MNSSSPADQRRRGPIVIAVVTWLLAISLLTLINHEALSHLAQQAQHSAPDTQVKALSTQVAALVHQVEAIQRQPRPISQVEWAHAHQTVEAQLTEVAHTQAGMASASDLKALQTRMDAVEAHLAETHSTATTRVRHPAVKATVPVPPLPPFHLLGTELRGGVVFVSVAPLGATSLAELRLLRPGDTDEGWQLQAIDAHVATFRVNGQEHALALPQGQP